MENKKQTSFLKFFYQEAKLFIWFSIVFAVLFHFVGSYIADITFKDVLPMYCVIAVLMLTMYTHLKKKYDILKDKDLI